MMGCSNPHPHGQVRFLKLLVHLTTTLADLSLSSNRPGPSPTSPLAPPPFFSPNATTLNRSSQSSKLPFCVLSSLSSSLILGADRSSPSRSTNGNPSLLLNYATSELAKHVNGDDDSRVVLVGKHFVAVVPFWASWPFETMVIPFQ